MLCSCQTGSILRRQRIDDVIANPNTDNETVPNASSDFNSTNYGSNENADVRFRISPDTEIYLGTDPIHYNVPFSLSRSSSVMGIVSGEGNEAPLSGFDVNPGGSSDDYHDDSTRLSQSSDDSDSSASNTWDLTRTGRYTVNRSEGTPSEGTDKYSMIHEQDRPSQQHWTRYV